MSDLTRGNSTFHRMTSATSLGIGAAVLVLCWSSRTNAVQPGERPYLAEPGMDLSAYRVDSDVFGWNKQFTEMAALASEVRRGPQGKIRGEAFILVFPVGSTQPIHNVQVQFITQAELPHDPVPLDDIRDHMVWLVEVQYQWTWPQRPVRKYYKGAMRVQPLWEPALVESGICQPAVGFLLQHQGKTRYQPHVPLELKAGCDYLRMTDVRTYWAKKDLGAVMIRFDYSSTDNESSMRFPLSFAWRLGQSLHIVLQAPLKSPRFQEARKKLEEYGTVQPQAGPPGDSWDITVKSELTYLGQRLARELKGNLRDRPLPPGVQVLITAASSTAPSESSRPTLTAEPDPLEQPECGGLLRDCD